MEQAREEGRDMRERISKSTARLLITRTMYDILCENDDARFFLASKYLIERAEQIVCAVARPAGTSSVSRDPSLGPEPAMHRWTHLILPTPVAGLWPAATDVFTAGRSRRLAAGLGICIPSLFFHPA